MDQRHEFHVYGRLTEEDGKTEFQTFYFPEVGNLTLTFESNDWYEGNCPVISIDFDPKKLRLIDGRGNDRAIQ